MKKLSLGAVVVLSLILTACPTATPDTSAAHAVGLGWNPVTTDTLGNPITNVSYKIYRSTNGVSFSVVGTSIVVQWVDTKVQPNNTYWYRTTALANGHESTASNMVFAKVKP